MPVSRQKHVSKRGNHRERVKSHDAYLQATFPNQFNLTNPYSAAVAELLDEELASYSEPNEETLAAMTHDEIQEALDYGIQEVSEGSGKSFATIKCPLVETTTECFVPTVVSNNHDQLLVIDSDLSDKESVKQVLHNLSVKALE